MQNFKGTAEEQKWIDAGQGAVEAINIQKDEFFTEAYLCNVLGDVLWESGRTPLANAITQDIFRTAFAEIFGAFIEGGTFESYITVFKKIFGDDVTITFTIPAAGRLQIEIDSNSVLISEFVARYIAGGAYIFDQVVDEVGDNIVFQTLAGFQSEYDLDQMLFEMVPNGIYTEITLNIT